MQLAEAFERLVLKILNVSRFNNAQLLDPDRQRRYDFLANESGITWAIEAVFYRTARAQPTLIENAAARLVKTMKDTPTDKAALIVSCIVPPDLRRVLEKKFTISLFDRHDLRMWALAVPQLAEELDALIGADGAAALEHPADLNKEGFDPSLHGFEASLVSDVEFEATKAERLCRELNKVKKGKISWLQYETVCENILRYLFPNDLEGWHKQKRTDDGLSRFDFVCRIRPTTEFWQFLIAHLNSRYILFEFKNYTGKIKQGQVLTTEKYLLDRGLRRVAIIFTRSGAEPHAISMAQGAMREHGKLMLIINDDQICEMLNKKYRGEDPSDYLFTIADEFLLSLPR